MIIAQIGKDTDHMKKMVINSRHKAVAYTKILMVMGQLKTYTFQNNLN